MRFVLVLVLVVACEKPSEHQVDPVSMNEAKEFATAFGSAARPCDVDKVAALMDGPALAAQLTKASQSQQAKNASALLQHPQAEARILCAWNKTADSYHVLHVLSADGRPRVVMRRLVREPRKHIVIVGYDELELGKSREDHKVRMTDLYSVTNGMSMSALMASGMDSVSAQGLGGSLDVANAIKEARELQDSGKPAEALAKIDALPASVRSSRMVQMMRVRLAEAVSADAYKQAIDEIVKTFPGDPSIAQLAVEAAFLGNDWDKALENIDIVDRAVGGDAFQDALRGMAYLKRGKPGDLDLAWQHVEAATKTEPTLGKGWYARLDVAVARKDYAAAVETIERLNDHFQANLTDETLRTVPSYADFVASPEYQAWRSRGG